MIRPDNRPGPVRISAGAKNAFDVWALGLMIVIVPVCSGRVRGNAGAHPFAAIHPSVPPDTRMEG